MNEGLWPFSAALAIICVLGSVWLATTGRMIGGRIPCVAERLTRAGALACLGVAALSQAMQHWIDHRVELTVVGLAGATAALGLFGWSWRLQARHR